MRAKTMNIDTLPAQPYIGLCFVPFTTDSIGHITKVEHVKIKGRKIATVTYYYEHSPEESFTRPYDEVLSMADLFVTESPLVEVAARTFPTPYDESTMPVVHPASSQAGLGTFRPGL